MKDNKNKDFIGYEYISINVNSERKHLYIDCYENFGWQLINDTALVDKDDYYINDYNSRIVNLKFKRDRKINNKAQLLILQRKMEISIKDVEKLEKEPFLKGIILSLSIGLIGILLLCISLLLINTNNLLYILCLIMGIIGLILPYFIYNRIKSTVEKNNITLIDEAYDSLYDICRQAKELTK